MTNLLLSKLLPLIVPFIAGILTNYAMSMGKTYSAWLDRQSTFVKRTIVGALAIGFTALATWSGIELNPDAPFADQASINALIAMVLAHVINKGKKKDAAKVSAGNSHNATYPFDLPQG